MAGARATAGAAAFAGLVALVGVGAFLLASDDDAPPTTTSSTTTIPAPPSEAEVAAAITDALIGDLAVPLTPAQASCVAGTYLSVVGTPAAVDLVEDPTPLAAVSVAQREQIVRGIVGCVPPDVAASLLGTTAPPQTLAPELPDEGTSG